MQRSSQNQLLQMKRLVKGMLEAKKQEGKSVVYLREAIVEEAVMTLTETPHCPLVPFGVKNTRQISKELVQKMGQEPGFLFHTLDKMAAGGRAIDIDLLNPLTGKVMTGSTSGGCVNILKGINDVAMGTDGGGSLLAPAISTGLYSIMAKGMGLEGTASRTSTDEIPFLPGIGLISHDYELCQRGITRLLSFSEKDPKASYGIDDGTPAAEVPLTIAIPRIKHTPLPNGRDMADYLLRITEKTKDWIQFKEFDLASLTSRRQMISAVNALFQEGADMVLTAEGPVDLYGTGDSVLGQWGETGERLQQAGGKYLLKIANMVHATAVSIPTEDLGVGIVLMGPKGLASGKKVMALGNRIKDCYRRPPLFESYFIHRKEAHQGFFESGGDTNEHTNHYGRN